VEQWLEYDQLSVLGLTRYHGHRVMRQWPAPNTDAHRRLDCGNRA
jgi:hypothetical protein